MIKTETAAARAHLPRGIATIADLKARSRVDPATHCWRWLGAASDGHPRIHTFDRIRGEKRTMAGPTAVWNIAHDEGVPPGWMPFRRCGQRDCVNPSHLRMAHSKAEMFGFIARSGSLKGRNAEQRRANVQRAHEANGITPTPAAVVLAIRAADPTLTNVALGREFGVSHGLVSRIRRGQSRRSVWEGTAA